jgi:hypothetical protein
MRTALFLVAGLLFLGASPGRLSKMENSLSLRTKVSPNRPVNADARVSAVLCWRLAARAGYWERYTYMRSCLTSQR